jgi:hypothetical protein
VSKRASFWSMLHLRQVGTPISVIRVIKVIKAIWLIRTSGTWAAARERRVEGEPKRESKRGPQRGHSGSKRFKERDQLLGRQSREGVH